MAFRKLDFNIFQEKSPKKLKVVRALLFAIVFVIVWYAHNVFVHIVYEYTLCMCTQYVYMCVHACVHAMLCM